MCGRFTRKESLQQIAEILGLETLPGLALRYNIAPSQHVLCVRNNPNTFQNEWVELQWGLVPSWMKVFKSSAARINARNDSVTTNGYFRHAFSRQRCLILADGFYEWGATVTPKQPYYIRFKDHRMFGFGGLWERWEKDGELHETCCIITTHPNSVVEPIHKRMPVIIQEQEYPTWLSSFQRNTMYMNGALKPYEPAKEMEAYPVSPRLNNPRNDSAECVKPLA